MQATKLPIFISRGLGIVPHVNTAIAPSTTLSLESGSRLLPASPTSIQAKLIGGRTREVRLIGDPLAIRC